MAYIDAKEAFAERRALAEAGRLGKMAPLHEGLANASRLRAARPRVAESGAKILRRYRDVVRAKDSLIADIDELCAWAEQLKVHSELLERESRKLLRELEGVLAVESTLKRSIEDM